MEEYTVKLLKHLFLLDSHNTYVLFANSFGDSSVSLDWVQGFPNVTVRRFRFPNKLLNLSLWYFGFPKIDRLLGGVDLFFMPNINFVALEKKTKLVLTMHDLSFFLFPETFSFKRKLWHMFVRPRVLCRRADSIIAVSKSTKEDIVRHWKIESNRVHAIASGLDKQFEPIGRNNPALLAVKEKYALPYKFILFLGTLEPRKNIAMLVRAYEILRRQANNGKSAQHKLVLAGLTGWKSESINREIQKNRFRKDIMRIGHVEEGDKAAVYSLCSLFVYPSLYEGFGFPVLEAMGSGAPVITSHTSSLPEIVGSGALLVDPIKPVEIAIAMREVLENGQLSAMLRDRGIRTAALFDWKKTAHDTLAVLQSATLKNRL